MVVERSHAFHSDEFKSASLKTASELYEYMDPRNSKTAGLIEALGAHGIDIKEAVTFGDADNDYDMTLNAGVGVVMANGSEKTKSVADALTDDNDHDGIGNYIFARYPIIDRLWPVFFLDRLLATCKMKVRGGYGCLAKTSRLALRKSK